MYEEKSWSGYLINKVLRHGAQNRVSVFFCWSGYLINKVLRPVMGGGGLGLKLEWLPD